MPIFDKVFGICLPNIVNTTNKMATRKVAVFPMTTAMYAEASAKIRSGVILQIRLQIRIHVFRCHVYRLTSDEYLKVTGSTITHQ